MLLWSSMPFASGWAATVQLPRNPCQPLLNVKMSLRCPVRRDQTYLIARCRPIFGLSIARRRCCPCFTVPISRGSRVSPHRSRYAMHHASMIDESRVFLCNPRLAIAIETSLLAGSDILILQQHQSSTENYRTKLSSD